MIEVRQPTMEFRFKKTQPKLVLTGQNVDPRGKIFLQQKFMVNIFDPEQKEDMMLPMGVSVEQVVPPQLLNHIEMVEQSTQGSMIKVPVMTGAKVHWFNIPSVDETSPDEIPIKIG